MKSSSMTPKPIACSIARCAPPGNWRSGQPSIKHTTPLCCLAATLSLVVAAIANQHASAATLLIGAAAADVTPDKPVALAGQFDTRISRGVDNPITATAVAIEAREGERPVDQAIFISCDTTSFRASVIDPLRERLRAKLPEVDPRKVIFTATHTHTAPAFEKGSYKIPADGVMQPEEYAAFLRERLEALIVQAWSQRHPGGVSWGVGHAVVGYNRRAVYADSAAKMYGAVNTQEFRGIEGGEDHALELLFFWNQQKQLLASGVNVACPSQEMEHGLKINADFWHDVRQQLHRDLAKDLFVLGWPGACGDLSPHHLYRKAAEQRMLKLRGLTATQDLGQRISREVVEVCPLTRSDLRTDVPFAHRVEELALPVRKVTEEEVAKAKQELEALKKKGDNTTRSTRFQNTIKRYQTQEQESTFTVEIHVLRMGDIAIATNPFELFQDYGTQMKGRSPAEETFILQLTCGHGGYLATPRAIAGGGYSAVVESNRVGPEGGQLLVNRTLDLITELFPKR